MGNKKLVMRHVPKIESLDEALTTNFSDLSESVLHEHSNVLQTIPESKEEVFEGIKVPMVEKRKTLIKPLASPIPVKKQKTPAKSPKTAMNSIFNQIKSRRKSSSGPSAASQGSQLAKSPVRIPAPKSNMITPLRRAIEARRAAIATPDDSNSNPGTPLSQQRTPSRRKSGCAAEFRKSMELPAPAPVFIPPNFLKIKLDGDPAVPAPVVASEPKEENLVRPNKSSLLREIEARRKSYSTTKTPSKTPSKTPKKAASVTRSKTPAKSPAGVAVAKAVVATLMEQILAQRKKTLYKSPRKSISTIRAESAKKNSAKKSATKKVATPETESEMEVVLPDEKIEDA